MRKIFEYEFPSTGVKVKTRKVSPYIAIEARAALSSDKSNPKPKPPERLVEEEGPLYGTVEVNESDPAFIEALALWERGINEKVMELQIKRGVVEICDPDWKADTEAFRQDAGAYGLDTLPADDTYVYILYLASGTREDLNNFALFLSSNTVPDQGVVQAALDTFPANP